MKFTYVANPVQVNAQVIRDVIRHGNDFRLSLEDASLRIVMQQFAQSFGSKHSRHQKRTRQAAG